MSEETVKWVIGSAGSAGMIVSGLVVYLVRLAYGIGQSAKAIESKLEKLTKIEERAERVPVIETKLEQLANAQTAHRAKTDSDIKELRRAVFRSSNPDFNGTCHEGEE